MRGTQDPRSTAPCAPVGSRRYAAVDSPARVDKGVQRLQRAFEETAR
ncbi:hypothetical protein [Kitasatospora sp. NPDC092286]